MSEDQTPAQAREQIEKLTKDLAKVNKANEDLLKENRGLKAETVFTGAGLNPNLAKLFVASAAPDLDITPENVKAFAEEYGIGSAAPANDEGTGEPVVTPTPKPEDNLANIGRAGSGAGQGGQPGSEAKTMTTGEFVELLKKDKVAAQTALAEGRVVVRDTNPYVRDRADMGDANPYDQFNKDRISGNQS